MEARLDLDPSSAPDPDLAANPSGFVVVVEPADRVHFLDWGGPARSAATAEGTSEAAGAGGPGVLLVHGIAQTAWIWTPVARRLIRERPTVALDLRGHGLSDAPTSGYDEATLTEDVVAVAEGSGLLGHGRIVLAGHGFGGAVAAWAAARLGERCAGLALVDGGWEDAGLATGLEPDEFLRTIDEPPEVLRSMTAFLADRRGFDPGSWDDDQEQAARATVVDTAAGRVVPATRPHALAGMVQALFSYRPLEVLPAVEAPIVALMAAEDEAGSRGPALERAQAARRAAGRGPMIVRRFPSSGHNLMRYHGAAVAAAILGLTSGPVAR